MMGVIGYAAPIVLPWVISGVGRAMGNYVNAKGPAKVFDYTYGRSQDTAGSWLGTLGRIAAAPISFGLAGEAANAAGPGIAMGAQAVNLLAPVLINAAGSYYFKPDAPQGHVVSDEEYKALQALKMKMALGEAV